MLENGDLMNAMQKEGFDYLVTSYKNLQYQQNISNYAPGFIMLNVMNNTCETILPMVEEIKLFLIDEAKVKLKVIPNT